MPDIPFVPEGGFGATHPNLGDVGNLILAALEAPGRGVRTVLGGGDEERFNQFARGAGRAFGQAAATPLGGVATRMASPVGGTLANIIALSQIAGVAPEETGAFMGESVGRGATDPLSYMGMGIPKAALQSVPAGSRAAQLLSIADRFDALPAVLLGKGADFIRGGAGAVGSALDVAAPTAHRIINPAKWIQPEITMGKTVRPSNDLLDYYLATSKQSHLRKAQRMAEGMAESLQAQDYNIQRGVLDEAALKAARTATAKAGRTPDPDDVLLALTGTKSRFDPTNPSSGESIMQGFQRQYDAQYADAPNALVRIAALEVRRSVDIANKAVWDATYGAAPTAVRYGKKPLDPATYQEAMRGVMVNMQAGKDVLDDAVRILSDAPLTNQQEVTLTQFANKTKAAMDQLRKTGEGVFSAAGKTLGQAYMTNVERRVAEESRMMDALQHLTGITMGRDAPRVEAGRWASMIGSRKAEISHVLEGRPGILALLPEGQASDVMSDTWGQLIKGATRSADTLNEMEAAFGRIYEAKSGLPYVPLEVGNQTPKKIMAHLNQNISDLAARGDIAPFTIKNQEDFIRFVRREGGNQEFLPLRKRLEEFPGVDLLSTPPIAASQDRAIRMLGPLYGVEEPRTLAQKVLELPKAAIRTTNSLWRDDVLGTLSYPLVNFSGALLNHSISGLSPTEALTRMVRSAVRSVTRPNARHWATDTRNLVQATGEAPFGAARGYAGDAAAQTSEAVRASSKVDASYWEKVLPGNFEVGPFKGNVTVGGLGALEGATGGAAVTPGDATEDERNRNIMLGAFLGMTAQGIGLPTRAKYARRLATGIEDGAREAVWLSVAHDTILKNRPIYEQVIRDAFTVPQAVTRSVARPFKPTATLPAKAVRPSAAVEAKTLAAVESSGYMLSPEAVNNLLTDAGVSEAGRMAAVKKWRNLNHEFNINGQRAAADIQFDYENLNNFQELMRDAIPFSTYALKAGPFFARILLEKPIIIETLARMQHDVDQSRRETGLTQRTAGATHFGVADAFWSSLLGYNVMAYYNPLKSVFPWSNTAQATEPRPGEMPYESILRAADFLGIPTPGPIPAAAMRLAGQQGDAPPPQLIRSAGPLQGITAAMGINRGKGIDIGAGLAGGERMLRGATGQDVSDPLASQTRNRLAEIYLATYGKPIDQGGPEAYKFYEAIANQQGPLWDHAAAQIAKEKGTRAVLATTFGPASPQALVTGEEAQIRQERKTQQVLSPEFSHRIQQAASKNPAGPASPADVQIMRDAALYFVNREFGLDELPSKAQALLDSGTNHGVNQVRKDMQALQAKQHPLSASYVATGGSSEAELQALLALQANQALQFPGGDILQAVNEARRETGMTGQLGGESGHLRGVQLLPAAKTRAAREALQAQHPILKAYEGWRLTHPDGNVDDFLKEYRRDKLK